MHRTYICDIERGARNISLENIARLARALDVSPVSLFSGQPGPQIPALESMVDILLVEDDPRDAEMTLTPLKDTANDVQVVGDGEAALDFLFCQGEFANRPPSRRPLLLLLDLGLPRMDGLEVLRRVKSDPRTATIPVVALAASDCDPGRQMSTSLGAAACIVKPLEMRHLLEAAPALPFRWALVKLEPALANQPHFYQLGQHDVAQESKE